jgi:hypothetical protein
MSADMARERRRRSWELKEEEALTAEEEEAQRRKERRKVRLHALGVPCTCADCGCRAVLALMQPACLPACLLREKRQGVPAPKFPRPKTLRCSHSALEHWPWFACFLACFLACLPACLPARADAG